MNYIEKYQLGSVIQNTSFSPKWEKLQGKQINIAPKSWNTLMPMKNPAFSSTLMYNKNNSYLDEYNKLITMQNILAGKLKASGISMQQKNKITGELSQYPGFISRLHEMQYKK